MSNVVFSPIIIMISILVSTQMFSEYTYTRWNQKGTLILMNFSLPPGAWNFL